MAHRYAQHRPTFIDVVHLVTAGNEGEPPLTLLQQLARATVIADICDVAEQLAMQREVELAISLLRERLIDQQQPLHAYKALRIVHFLLLHGSHNFAERAQRLLPGVRIRDTSLSSSYSLLIDLRELLADDSQLTKARDAAQRDSLSSIIYPFPPALTRPARSGDQPILVLSEPDGAAVTIDKAEAEQGVQRLFREVEVLGDNRKLPDSLSEAARKLVVASRRVDGHASLLATLWQHLVQSSRTTSMGFCRLMVMMLLMYGSVRAVEELRVHRYAMASIVSHFRAFERTTDRRSGSSWHQHVYNAMEVEDLVWSMLMLLEEPSRINLMRSDPTGRRLTQAPGNYRLRGVSESCADCSRPHGLLWLSSICWASLTLGVFLCSRCAYIHSTLPGDKSIIRHWIWDAWSSDEMEVMGAKNNAAINDIYKATMSAHRMIKPDDSVEEVERFIRHKYESRLWVDERREAKVTKAAAVAVVTTSDVSTEMRSAARMSYERDEQLAAEVESTHRRSPSDVPLRLRAAQLTL